jgi:hypothetical protein
LGSLRFGEFERFGEFGRFGRLGKKFLVPQKSTRSYFHSRKKKHKKKTRLKKRLNCKNFIDSLREHENGRGKWDGGSRQCWRVLKEDPQNVSQADDFDGAVLRIHNVNSVVPCCFQFCHHKPELFLSWLIVVSGVWIDCR